MEYQEFVCQVKQRVAACAGLGARVEVNSILKNNLSTIDGLTIRRAGDNVAPAIWLNPLYARYACGDTTVEQIAEDIVEYHADNCHPGTFDLSFYLDFNRVKGRIVYKLIHRGMNGDLLREVPHREFLDLAAVYCYKMEGDTFGNSSILVKNEHMKIWGTDEKELDRLARENTLRIAPAEFLDILDLIGEAIGEKVEGVLSPEIPMYVLTNQDRNFGASCAMFPQVLAGIAEKLGADYFLLPSSIHEFIILPVAGEVQPEELHTVVSEINEEHVAAEEVLGNSVYRYSHLTGRLTVAYQEVQSGEGAELH